MKRLGYEVRGKIRQAIKLQSKIKTSYISKINFNQFFFFQKFKLLITKQQKQKQENKVKKNKKEIKKRKAK